MCSIIGVGERLHKVLGQFGSKFSFPWQQKAPIDLQWGNYVHLFSVVFDPTRLKRPDLTLACERSLPFGLLVSKSDIKLALRMCKS